MADSYINATGLQAIKQWIVSTFAKGSEIPTATSDLTNDGDGNSNFATESYVDQNGGKIDKITVNGTEQTITNKTVALTVPTKVSDLANDSKFQTDTEVQSKIDAAVSRVLRYKGSVANYAALEAIASKEEGDVYDVQDTGMNYAWNGTTWDPLGSSVDLSAYWSKEELKAMTVAEVNAILEA